MAHLLLNVAAPASAGADCPQPAVERPRTTKQKPATPIRRDNLFKNPPLWTGIDLYSKTYLDLLFDGDFEKCTRIEMTIATKPKIHKAAAPER